MGFSLLHLILILLILLILFGPSRIPQVGKAIGKAVRGFKEGLREEKEIDVTHSVQMEPLDRHEESPSVSFSEPETKAAKPKKQKVRPYDS